MNELPGCTEPDITQRPVQKPARLATFLKQNHVATDAEEIERVGTVSKQKYRSKNETRKVSAAPFAYPIHSAFMKMS